MTSQPYFFWRCRIPSVKLNLWFQQQINLISGSANMTSFTYQEFDRQPGSRASPHLEFHQYLGNDLVNDLPNNLDSGICMPIEFIVWVEGMRIIVFHTYLNNLRRRGNELKVLSLYTITHPPKSGLKLEILTSSLCFKTLFSYRPV